MQPATSTIIASCYETQAGQAFSYIGSDQRLYLYLQPEGPGTSWQTIDLIAQWQSQVDITLPFPRTGAGPRGNGPIAMNTFKAMVGFFLFYIDQDGHIQALPHPIDDSTYAPRGWPPGSTLTSALFPDVTARTGAPPAATDSGLASYAWESQQTQHIVYVGEDGNVWELYWKAGEWDDTRSGPLWRSNNLSAHTGYTGVLGPKKNGPLAATMFESQGTEHVVYIAGDNTIRELYYYPDYWGGNNLTEATGAQPPAANSPLVTFACAYENTLHVVYLGADGAIHELWWATNGGWQPDHTISQYAATPASDTALAGYVCEFDSSHHVLFVDTLTNLQELYRKGGSWGHSILNFSAGSGATPLLSTATPLAGNADEDTKSEHVFYLDNRTRVHELYRHHNEWFAGEIAA